MDRWESIGRQEKLITTNLSGPDMRDLKNYFMIIVSLYCDDDDYNYVITNNDITAGYWLIGDPATEAGGVGSANPPGYLWPHQVRSWVYLVSDEFQSDPQLTVTGNIYINIPCVNIDIISPVEGAPGYPENLIVKDQTGDRANLAGGYKREGDSRVWKYEDFEISFNGKY